MECSDIEHIIDFHRTSRLTNRSKISLNRHLLLCRICAEEWLVNEILLSQRYDETPCPDCVARRPIH